MDDFKKIFDAIAKEIGDENGVIIMKPVEFKQNVKDEAE